MDKLKYIKLENEDGSYSSSIPLAVDSDYVDVNGNTLTSELNNKATKSEVQSLASGSPLVASSTSEMIDTTRVYVNITDGKWYYYDGDSWEIGGTYQSTGIADDSVTPIKTDFMNLYDNIPILDNKYAVGTTGNISDGGASWKCTDYLKIPNALIGKKILVRTHIKLNAAICLYDPFKNFVSSITDTSDQLKEYEVLIPEGVGYIVVSCLTADISNLYIGLIDAKTLIDDDKRYYDWLDYEDLTVEGSFVNASTGAIASHVDLDRTDYVEIPKILLGTTIQISTFISGQAGICFYDKNKNFISGVGTEASNFHNYKVQIPQNASYIIISCRNNAASLEDHFKVLSIKDPTETVEDLDYKKYNMFAVYRNVGVVGDSLSSGASAVHDDRANPCPDNYDYSWPQFMGRMNKGNYINFTRGGLNTETWFTNANGYAKAMLPENKCECYLLAIGTNDASGKGMDYLGNINDIDLNDYTQNANSFYGNYGKIIQVLRANSPKCHIFVITMPRSDSTRVAYNTAMKNIAELFNDCFVIDMEEYYNSYYVNGFIFENLRQGHFNAVAYNAMAILLDDILDKFMYDNLKYFKYIDFINTQYENEIPIIN